MVLWRVVVGGEMTEMTEKATQGRAEPLPVITSHKWQLHYTELIPGLIRMTACRFYYTYRA